MDTILISTEKTIFFSGSYIGNTVEHIWRPFVGWEDNVL